MTRRAQDGLPGAKSPIIAQAHGGLRLRAATGLSIYFPPFRDSSAFYQDLDFSRQTWWAEFLESYLGRELVGAEDYAGRKRTTWSFPACGTSSTRGLGLIPVEPSAIVNGNRAGDCSS